MLEAEQESLLLYKFSMICVCGIIRQEKAMRVSGEIHACVCVQMWRGKWGFLHHIARDEILSEGVPGCNQLGRDPL